MPLELIRGLVNLAPRHRGCVLSIGNFDGVHLGHQALLAALTKTAAAHGLPPTVMSFDPTPKEYFTPQAAPPRVCGLRDKLALMRAAGVERLLLVRFCRDFAAQTPQQFAGALLAQRLGVAALVVGDDFRFGHDRAGDLATLQALGHEHGFAVHSIAGIGVDGLRCSSTALRAALAEADLATAAKLLGRPYSLCGRVRHGLRLGRTLGLPTANLAMTRPMALRRGVYAVRVECEGRCWAGVANFGVRPTLGLNRLLLEAHLFADTGELYGRELRVTFSRFLRPEQRFASIEALAAQIRRDAEAAQDHFAAEP